VQHYEYSALVQAFPNLKPSDYQNTSPATYNYNCIAWASGEDQSWWWPVPEVGGHYWPPGLARILTLENFIKVFENLGYQACDDDTLEDGFEKIAVYVDGSGEPTHAARQLEIGAWTSKLGPAQDIIHSTLAVLEGGVYGRVAQVMKRPRSL